MQKPFGQEFMSPRYSEHLGKEMYSERAPSVDPADASTFASKDSSPLGWSMAVGWTELGPLKCRAQRRDSSCLGLHVVLMSGATEDTDKWLLSATSSGTGKWA